MNQDFDFDYRTGDAPRGQARRGRGFGQPGRGPGGHQRRRAGRRARGDVRNAILMLLAEEPMHGYQLMETIVERSGGRWHPSPGAIYPTLRQLEEEGLVTINPIGGGRHQVTLTEQGRTLVDTEAGSWPDPFASAHDSTDEIDLRGEMTQLHEAARVIARTGTQAQRRAAVALVAEARRGLYLLLAGEFAADEDPDDTGTQADRE